MIHLNFISSPDESIKGDFVVYYHNLVISSRKGSDLEIDDDQIKKSVVFKTTQNGLKISCEEYFYIDGKKISGNKILQIGETIQIGQTQIRVMGQIPEASERKKSILDSLEERVRSEPEISGLIIELEKELIRIEQDKKTP